MTPYPKLLIGAFIRAAVALTIVLLAQPALSQEPSVLGSAIPLIEGATVLKEKQFEGSGRFEFEVGISPSEAVEFYHQAMQARGWPPGQVMSNGQACVLMLMRQGDMITVQAKNKGDRTHVTLSVVLKSSIAKALDPQTAQRHHKVTEPVPAKKEKKIPSGRGVTIKGAPITKGELVRRYQFPDRNGSGSPPGKGNDGNPPDDPSPPKDDEPEAEDPSSDDAFPSESAFDIHNDLPDSLYALIRATVRWQVTDPDEYRYSGSISLHLKGHMKLWEEASPTVQGGLGAFQPARTYRAESGSVSYVYDEKRISLKPIPSGHCQDPLIVEYHDVGKLPLSDKGMFKMHRYAAMAAPNLQNLSADKQRFLSAFQSAAPLPDYYELFLAPAGTVKRIPGKRKASGKEVCTYTPVDRAFPGCLIGIQVEPQASGQLAGSRTWQADDQGLCPPSLGISIQEIAATQNQKPLKPPAGGKMNVTYSLSWQLSENDPTSHPQENPLTTDDGDEDPCEILQDRMNFISVVRAAYKNTSIREYVDKQNYDLGTKMAMYQKAVENAVIDARNGNADFFDQVSDASSAEGENVAPYPESRETPLEADDLFYDGDKPLCQSEKLDSTQAETNMSAHANQNLDGSKNNWGYPLGSTNIVDHCTGSPVKIEIYDKNGNLLSQDLYSALACWQKKFGNEAGQARFEAALKHERTHVDQYTRKGPIKSLDDMATRELEAYQNEYNELLKDKRKLNCN